jgi:hypothetical protein
MNIKLLTLNSVYLWKKNNEIYRLETNHLKNSDNIEICGKLVSNPKIVYFIKNNKNSIKHQINPAVDSLEDIAKKVNLINLDIKNGNGYTAVFNQYNNSEIIQTSLLRKVSLQI